MCESMFFFDSWYMRIKRSCFPWCQCMRHMPPLRCSDPVMLFCCIALHKSKLTPPLNFLFIDILQFFPQYLLALSLSLFSLFCCGRGCRGLGIAG